MRAVWSAVLVSCLCSLSGCQSWAQVGQAIPNGSRVAPPGTGSYQVPSGYYNGAKASTTGAPAPTTSSNNQFGSNSNVTTAAWQPPTVDQLRNGLNNTASAAINDATNRANQVVQAGTSRAAEAIEQYTDSALPGDSGPPALPDSTSRSISDSQPIGSQPLPTKLDWQTPR